MEHEISRTPTALAGIDDGTQRTFENVGTEPVNLVHKDADVAPDRADEPSHVIHPEKTAVVTVASGNYLFAWVSLSNGRLLEVVTATLAG